MMTSNTAQHSGSIFKIANAVGRRILTVATGAAIGLALSFAPAGAQSQFRPLVQVDGMVITAFEVAERQKFLTLLRAPGDVRALARDQLINEKIQMREAEKLGIAAEPDAVKAGMEEFAARGNLTADQLLQFFAQAGIDASTFRDFVTAGVTWREFAKAKFVPMISLSNADIDAASVDATAEPGLRVLLSEIVLPAGDPATRKASMARAQRLTGLSEDEFRDAAQRFSIGGSRSNGGKLKWADVTALPAASIPAVRGLRPGQSSRIVSSEDALRIYYMHDREEVRGGTPPTVVDYAALLIAGGQSEANLAEAAKIRAEITTCGELYPLGRGLPPEQLVREEVRESQVPAAYRAELDRLDPGEISTRLTTSSGAMVVLMLCHRGNELPRSLTRDMIEEQLRNQRVGTMAQQFLDAQRAKARIEVFGN